MAIVYVCGYPQSGYFRSGHPRSRYPWSGYPRLGTCVLHVKPLKKFISNSLLNSLSPNSFSCQLLSTWSATLQAKLALKKNMNVINFLEATSKFFFKRLFLSMYSCCYPAYPTIERPDEHTNRRTPMGPYLSQHLRVA